MPAVPDTIEHLRATVAGMLDEPASDIADHDDLLLDWGLDSIRVIGFVEELRAGGVRVRLDELAEQPTIAAWHALISERRSGT